MESLCCLQIEEHTSLMHVHIFGTYFGLAVSWWLYHPSLSKRIEKETSNLISDLFSMLGKAFTSTSQSMVGSGMNDFGDWEWGIEPFTAKLKGQIQPSD